jgi:hypothetical protein
MAEDHFHRRRRVRRDKLIITLSSRLISNIILRGRCDLAESRVSARGVVAMLRRLHTHPSCSARFLSPPRHPLFYTPCAYLSALRCSRGEVEFDPFLVPFCE